MAEGMRYIKLVAPNKAEDGSDDINTGTLNMIRGLLKFRCPEMKQFANQVHCWKLLNHIEGKDEQEYLELTETDWKWLKDMLSKCDYTGLFVGSMLADIENPPNVRV